MTAYDFRNYSRRYRAERPLAMAARYVISRMIRRGEKERASAHLCVDCGAQARDWDHRDYSKPLDVEPVCRGCNVRRGPGAPYLCVPSVGRIKPRDGRRIPENARAA